MVGVFVAQSVPPRKDIPAIAKAANGAVVSIIMLDKDGNPIAQGTGFLISEDGNIVTNYHVIENGRSAIAKLPDGAFYLVDGVVVFDKARDVAVIKAHGENFRTLTLGDSDQLEVGEEVVAIGNPLSLESTVSNGIVSGIRFIEEGGQKFLQTTAPISPGSSGGPLFNMTGQVVGITTLYINAGENLNFAIPINDAKQLLLAKFSKVRELPDESEPTKTQTGERDATDKFHLREECKSLAAELETGLSGATRTDTVTSWSFNYSAKYNGCYVLESTQNRAVNYKTRTLFDGQTRDLLAVVTENRETNVKFGSILFAHPDCSPGSDCGYSSAQKYIDERMQPDEPPSAAARPSIQTSTGQYGGIVHNESASLSAEFGIVVNEARGVITGCMLVQEPLFGSGPLAGRAKDSDIVFVVTSAIGRITFVGQRRNTEINGTYIVERQGYPDQHGNFTLHKVTSEGLPTGLDTRRCPTDAEIHK
jgi:hypothetical protein